MAPTAEDLVSLYADALLEDSIDGHFCLVRTGAAYTPLLGDRPNLINADSVLAIQCGAPFTRQTRMLLRPPAAPLDAEARARVRGYAELYGARALALGEMADDIGTECGLMLRERFVLGRRLAGLATLDIAAEAGLTIATVSEIERNAIRRLNAPNLAEAIAFAARRGWLAITNVNNCSSSLVKLKYTGSENG